MLLYALPVLNPPFITTEPGNDWQLACFDMARFKAKDRKELLHAWEVANGDAQRAVFDLMRNIATTIVEN